MTNIQCFGMGMLFVILLFCVAKILWDFGNNSLVERKLDILNSNIEILKKEVNRQNSMILIRGEYFAKKLKELEK